ncbi:MAG: hypothetical protein GX151_02780 [Gammaproteobacteria bacterium]|uniref:DUF4870 family protein n=1 Tax=Acinetobacter TaxID=469 RepID=UPI00144734B4|nr:MULTISPECIES: hypothetical protein [Acinetobacter]MEB6566012.1 hypothetical protein [Acinetobacter towneri]NLN56883.1 hypothetical protein [Gammaproteobacteria bacterium]
MTQTIELNQLKQYNLITYILYLVGFVVGITGLIAIIMNYVKRNEMRGTWLESHVDWQIKTFWYSLIGYIVGFLLTAILIGYVIILVVFIWHVYRLIKGLIALNDNKPIQA